MVKKTILTAAITGNLMSPENSPHLPITPKQIAEQALDAAKAGASIVHLHVRDPETAKGSMRLELYRELVQRIREQDEEVILNLTTGEGGRFIPSDDDPQIAAPGSTLCAPDKRVAHVEELRPDICTLDFNTMWSGQASVINTPRNLEIMAGRIYAAGVKPEIEIFDSGDLHMLKDFLSRGVIKKPLMVQMVLGVRFGAVANPETMAYLVSQLPEETEWAAFGIGRMAFPMLAQAFLLGGHCRIGMEDTAYIEKGEYCRSNAQLVEKGTSIIHSLGGTIASSGEARTILGLS
ncbi:MULTISPECIES: beta-keto acid cleavage family enzyme [Rhizobium/Agrobacterium group]|uniref:3-keto-5-aminohexanoate cleavage protein n=2 Tax=Rhizobium/Agrobacterium group TaxID=227290 RepID=A0A9X3KQP1_9HYPH|nr:MULTISPECIES: 3-keto-5-aminohexanoate cleavage protein [Rhizobium/Agrobacterium group]MBO9126213.1 3-keto-5-aminohexanoate cleavage protein [Rhizobium sp. 16-488-2b]MBO9176797.1 3-keto-5-aminohexanoate cleavage protein [Rhizobium sp. 16-488-2a]MBO9197366.1 3-keto-5-aminohexanoate cleavage protein [Rhizobium sp. 16-449-1b]MCZ7466773.1 3-keto-5-aminohexanoate cleavage protein [Rhizobium rhizogenes]MCZ7939197.1 3-keto-5-aminohexanoate cleavage protein [Agrobacterium salinitolerans]